MVHGANWNFCPSGLFGCDSPSEIAVIDSHFGIAVERTIRHPLDYTRPAMA